VTGIHEVHVRHQLYAANSEASGRAHVNGIKLAYDFKVNSSALPEKMDISFRIIDKYAQSLLLLTANKQTNNIDSFSKNFGTGIDSLITLYNSKTTSGKLPTGIGGAVGTLVAKGGELYIRAKQAKYIREFVPQGDTLIAVMIDNLLGYLQTSFPTPADTVSILGLIEAERISTREDYLTFAQQVRPTIENDRDYFQMLADLDNAKLLYTQTIQGAKNLRAAHKQLLEVIKGKKALTETVKELQDYYESVRSMRSTYSKISAR
jgi:hypothetical protein